MAATAGFTTHVTCRLTAKNRDQLRTVRWVIEYRLPLPFFYLPALAGTTPGARRRGRPRTAWVAAVSVVYRRPTGAVVTVQRVRRRLQMSRLQTRLDNIKTWTELPRGRVSQNDRGQR